MTRRGCPECGGERGSQGENPAFPFCSERCKLLDLAGWLSGDYRIAVRPDESERDLPVELEMAAARLRERASKERPS